MTTGPKVGRRSRLRTLYGVRSSRVPLSLIALSWVVLHTAGLVSHNVIVQLRPGLDERAKVRIVRASVAAFGVLEPIAA